MYSSTFPLFKVFLQARVPDTPENRRVIEEANATSPYSLGPRLHVSSQQMARWIAECLDLPYLNVVDNSSIQLDLLHPSYCRENNVLPIEESGQRAFALSNPFDWHVFNSLATFQEEGQTLRLFVIEPEKIQALFGRQRQTQHANLVSIPEIVLQYQEKYDLKGEDHFDLHESDAASEPIVLLINELIIDAYTIGASDIHIEPADGSVVVRYRVDGELKISHQLRPRSIIRPLVSRLKVMGGLDISERRLPQDGRIVFKEHSTFDANFDLRLSIAPMQYGEKIVMRIVDKELSLLPLNKLGFSKRHLALYRANVTTPYGMILHVGPTGSGKSMTLYAAMNELQRPEINIQTAEDPIEYSIPGINQLQIKPEIGLTFGRALRCYLRQDPDIILLGEIRDLETARIAVEAGLTGHLLMSTLHTNDAASTVTRFIQMGIEPFMVSSSIVLICAQRLIRRLCPDCKQPFDAEEKHRRLAGIPDNESGTLWRPGGCEKCNDIGYRGRVGVHEILIPNDALRLAINQVGITSEALKRLAVDECEMTTLYWDAMEKVRQGVTSLDEALAKVRP